MNNQKFNIGDRVFIVLENPNSVLEIDVGNITNIIEGFGKSCIEIDERFFIYNSSRVELYSEEAIKNKINEFKLSKMRYINECCDDAIKKSELGFKNGQHYY